MKKGKIWISILIFIYTINLTYLKVYTNFHNPKSSSCWENWQKCPICVIYRIDRRNNWKFEKEGKMRISSFVFIYTIHLAYLKVYTKFHNPKSRSCWENSDENCPYVLYSSDRRNNWNLKKRRQNEDKHPNFIYTIHFAYLKLYTKFHNPKSNSCWENSDEKCSSVLYRSDRRKN